MINQDVTSDMLLALRYRFHSLSKVTGSIAGGDTEICYGLYVSPQNV